MRKYKSYDVHVSSWDSFWYQAVEQAIPIWCILWWMETREVSFLRCMLTKKEAQMISTLERVEEVALSPRYENSETKTKVFYSYQPPMPELIKGKRKPRDPYTITRWRKTRKRIICKLVWCDWVRVNESNIWETSCTWDECRRCWDLYETCCTRIF